MSKESKNKNEVINFIFDNNICLYFVLKDWDVTMVTQVYKEKSKGKSTLCDLARKKNSFSTITSE